VVPPLRHMTLRQATLALRRAHCRLGKVRRPRHVRRHHILRVSGQSARPRTRHRSGYPVDIRLA
jgi:hypothetical protein